MIDEKDRISLIEYRPAYSIIKFNRKIRNY
jgi:hypothetical protein